MDNNLYREEILEHYKSPLHFSKLKDFDTTSMQLNPFCGDEISVYIKFEKVRKSAGVATDSPPGCKIKDISFSGGGCALSIAAASMLTDFAIGKSKTELTKFADQDMLNLLGIEVSETRKKCALLALFTLRDCL
ncbi:MAG: iron-sulfur cluster assembly scaffold protein [Candidatus Levybacteria bacterium]|nr:iron-sulfur cluster assembly scaffold protein [Candidatus Levybacteria bacterium]